MTQLTSMEIAKKVQSLNRVPAGTAAIITDPGLATLMIKRHGAHGSGTWSVPGGWVDAGEDPRETVIRELAEEVGSPQARAHRATAWHRVGGGLSLRTRHA